mgnify:CR=1 FL=1
MNQIKDLGEPIITANIPKDPKPPNTVTAKDGVYLDVATQIYVGILQTARTAQPLTTEEEIKEQLGIYAHMACDAANALIKETNRRLVGYKGDTFKDD